MNRYRAIAAVVSFCFAVSLSASHAYLSAEELSIDELLDLDLATLFNVQIETASGTKETLLDAPATMVIITAKQIEQRGYDNLVEILNDIQGFDVTVPNSAVYAISHQRGYRVPAMNRTLLMFNGIVDNGLWSQEAILSRQYPLSNIKRIEILYGPASAVYGPNAFAGVINVITDNANELETGTLTGEVNVLKGSFQSRGVDATVQAKPRKDWSFSVTTKVFKSNEANMAGRWGFVSNEQLSNRTTWGGILDYAHEGEPLGHYYDPTDDYGVLADVQYKGLKLGIIHWKFKEAYGSYYATDRVQSNLFWNKASDQYYLEYRANPTDKLTTHTFLSYKGNRQYGYWGEAQPDSNPSKEDYSFISLTQWNTDNNSQLFEQDIEYQFHDNWMLLAGIKYQRKELSRSYDVPGYWEPAFSSNVEAGSGIGHSSDPFYQAPPPPPKEMPASNLIQTHDIGGYIQSIIDYQALRFNLGIRYDKNSVYGRFVNPRLSMIYKYNPTWTFKLLYGRAFQEPPPILLWGGWNGRLANEDLKPERVQNIEFIVLNQWRKFFQQVSLYRTHYSDVIKEEAENAGERNIYGLEYQLNAAFDNFLADAGDIEWYFNYSYTRAQSQLYYDQALAEWRLGEAELGDIAPHKWNIGVHMPFNDHWSINLRGNYVGKREPYLRNPLRGKRKIERYFLLNGTVTYQHKPFEVRLKVLNILNKEYFHPGGESASAGDDFSQRSQGFQNSLLPQPERSYWLNLRWQF